MSPAQERAADVERWISFGRGSIAAGPERAFAALQFVRELAERVMPGAHLKSCRCPSCEAVALLNAGKETTDAE